MITMLIPFMLITVDIIAYMCSLQFSPHLICHFSSLFLGICMYTYASTSIPSSVASIIVHYHRLMLNGLIKNSQMLRQEQSEKKSDHNQDIKIKSLFFPHYRITRLRLHFFFTKPKERKKSNNDQMELISRVCTFLGSFMLASCPAKIHFFLNSSIHFQTRSEIHNSIPRFGANGQFERFNLFVRKCTRAHKFLCSISVCTTKSSSTDSSIKNRTKTSAQTWKKPCFECASAAPRYESWNSLFDLRSITKTWTRGTLTVRRDGYQRFWFRIHFNNRYW